MATTQDDHRGARVAAGHRAARRRPARGPDREFTVKARSQRQQIVRHFLHNRVGMTGLVIFVLLLLFGFVGPLINPKAYDEPQRARPVRAARAPTGYLLGSDAIGQDLLSGIMSGIQRSLLIVLLFVVIALPVGLAIGAVAGYFGKWADSVLMRIVDLILTVPLFVVLVVVASNFPNARTPLGVGVILGVFGWMDLSRIVRSQFLSLREKEYVEAAHALGASNSPDHLPAPDPERAGLAHRLDDAARPPRRSSLETALTYLGFGVNGANQTSLGRAGLRRRPGRRHPALAVLLPRASRC